MGDAELLLMVESRKKSGVVAALLNLVLPGAGYMYCGRWILGIFAFLLVVALFLISLGAFAGFLALMLILDGFLCAGRYNRKLIERILAERAAARPQGFADGSSAIPVVDVRNTDEFDDALVWRDKSSARHQR